MDSFLAVVFLTAIIFCAAHGDNVGGATKNLGNNAADVGSATGELVADGTMQGANTVAQGSKDTWKKVQGAFGKRNGAPNQCGASAVTAGVAFVVSCIMAQRYAVHH